MTTDEILAAFHQVYDPALAAARRAKDPEAREPREVLAADLARTLPVAERGKDVILRVAKELHADRRTAQKIEQANDPIDPNRTADLLEADQLSRGVTRTTAKNLLFPGAWEDLRLGRVDRAAVKLAAGRLVGASDEALAAAIERARDADPVRYPNRARAAKMGQVAADEFAKVWLEVTVAEANLKALIGRGPDSAAASIAVKLREGTLAVTEDRPVRSDVELGLPTHAPTPSQRVSDVGPVRPAGQR